MKSHRSVDQVDNSNELTNELTSHIKNHRTITVGLDT